MEKWNKSIHELLATAASAVLKLSTFLAPAETWSVKEKRDLREIENAIIIVSKSLF
jgi:hypothetical protein